MQKERQNFIPALGVDWATRFYDPLVRITTREFTFKRALIKQAGLDNDQTILDLACGTGTLSIGIKRRFPGIRILAVDADLKILQRAEQKSTKRNLSIDFWQSFSDKLPFADEKFERVFSTLFFHHLTLEKKFATISEILRVLKPGGEFHLADYGSPFNITQKIMSNIIRLIDGDESTTDNLSGRLAFLLKNNGFAKVEKTGHFNTILGTIRLFRAFK